MSDLAAEKAPARPAWRARLRQFTAGALDWFVLPLCAVLPWRVTFRALRRIARFDWLMRDATRAALAGIGLWRAPEDPVAWSAGNRLTHLVDRGDVWVSRFRSDRWMDRHLVVDGDPWPDGPFIGITFHYGQGLWSLRHLCRGGRRATLLSTRFDSAYFGRAPLLYGFALVRAREVERVMRAPITYTGRSVTEMRAALASGVSVIGLIDVPPGQTRGAEPVEFLDQRAWFPRGLLVLARRANVPAVVYTLNCDRHSGLRRLHIRQVSEGSDEERLRTVVQLLEAALIADTSSWHRWADLAAFREAPAQAAEAAAEANNGDRDGVCE